MFGKIGNGNVGPDSEKTGIENDKEPPKNLRNIGYEINIYRK